MPKDISWSRIAGWILLGLEALWALLFLAFVFVFQFAGATEAVRLGLILTAFHAGAPLALILALERTGDEEHHNSVRLTLAHGFWIIFAAVTDLWSVFHAFLTLAEVDNIYQSALRALTVLAIVMSSLTAIWYFVMYCLQRKVSHKKKSILREVVEESERDIEEAESMHAPLRRKIVHQPNKF